MNSSSPTRTAVYWLLLMALVVGLSVVSGQIWGGKPEEAVEIEQVVISEEMTMLQFGQANGLSNPDLKQIFGLQDRSDLQKKISEYGSPRQITARVTRKRALASEHAAKNWIKIPVKFGLWFVFLAAVFVVFQRRQMSPGLRKGLLLSTVLMFGVLLGADPSPMGTVKDAIHLYGTTRAVFPPRMIALTVFLIIVFLANKYICAWGCQAGALQDLIYRLNQNKKGRAVIGRQLKVPFVLTNTVRCAGLGLFTVAAFQSGIDIIAPIDPFKIFKPAYLGLTGIVFVGILLMASLFIYRPWCHFLCPFGLAGWLVEKVSRVKISVDYDTCIACRKCAEACPSTVMSAILLRDRKTIPDCFACYSCREVCPTGAIRFSTRQRTLPPAGHFDSKR